MSGCKGNGRKRQWTDQQMLAALKRMEDSPEFVGVHYYNAHRLPDDPSSQAIVFRFKNWNQAKLAAGLPIRAQKRRVNWHLECQEDEVELPEMIKSTYPCWKCRRDYQGMGHKQGDWFCETCRLTVREWAANMAWLG